jgi:flagellar biosynthetic protein FliP
MRARFLVGAALAAAGGAAFAQQGGGNLPLVIGQGPGGTTYSVPVQTLLFFTALSFLPAVLLLMTAFTRIVIVLSLLRQALGTQAAPPNQVIIGLSLFLTFFVMSPTFDKVYQQAWAPYSAGTLPAEQALQQGVLPLREFMLKNTRQADVQLFARLAKLPADVKGQNWENSVPLSVLVPAFVTSELKSAFQIGFMIFVPFLIIDMIVASVLMSLGMMMLSPVLVALPFKLMLFVLADGWNLLLGSLAASFAT